jgi:hypothetical protein
MYEGRIITEDAGSAIYKTPSSCLKISFKIFMKFVCGEVHNLNIKIPLFQSFEGVMTKDFGVEVDISGDRGSTVVKVLRYKSEGRWFDPRWCHGIFIDIDSSDHTMVLGSTQPLK